MPVAGRIFLHEPAALSLADFEALTTKHASTRPFANAMSSSTRPKVRSGC
jgi:hypothetical protein